MPRFNSENTMSNKHTPSFSVAPMMNWTTRHCRYFHRQLSKHAKLYTEMVTSSAIIFGEHQRFLRYNTSEHPLALQIGGGDPDELAKAVATVAPYQFDEINLNVGCPSDRVQKGDIGAILMKNPKQVAACFQAMQQQTHTPITIKNRLSVDDMPEETVFKFIDTVATAGCKTFIIHARKAFLKGLDPKQNRDVPPLNYPLVYQVKEKFPELEIIINGGIKTLAETQTHLKYVDGVMMGREAYHNPWVLTEVDSLFGEQAFTENRFDILNKMKSYIEAQINEGEHVKQIAKHFLGLFHGQRGTRAFKQYLNDHMNQNNSSTVIDGAIAAVKAAESSQMRANEQQ